MLTTFKPIRFSWVRRATNLFVFKLLTVFLLFCTPAARSTEPSAPAIPSPASETNSTTEVRKLIEQQTSNVRGLKFTKPVQYKMIERAKLRSVLVGKVQEQFTEQELRDYSRSLATMGLIPVGTDLMEAIISLYDEQVAAFYIPEERSLYTFNDMAWSSSLDRMILAHELTHALQDQTYDLTTFPLKKKDNDDLVLAIAGLVEGDATLLMTQWYALHSDPSNMLQDVASMLSQNTEKLLNAPAYLRLTLLFPYQQGAEFATALYDAGGTKALDEAFRNPPSCTRHILHPETYFPNRQDPSKIEMVQKDLPKWRLIGNNVVGEFGLRILLEQGLGSWQSKLLAREWDGDRYHVYERGTNGPTAMIWETAWESDIGAADFESAFERIQLKRHLPPSVKTRLWRKGNRVSIQQTADESFFDAINAH